MKIQVFVWVFLFCLSFMVSTVSHAQTNAIWGQSYEDNQMLLESNYKSSLSYKTSLNRTDYYSLQESYASHSGDLLIKRYYGLLQDNNGEVVKGADSILYSTNQITTGMFLGTKEDEVTYINLFSTNTKNIDSLYFGWNYTVLNLYSNKGKPEVCKNKQNINLIQKKRYHRNHISQSNIGASRIGVHSYRVFILQKDTLYVFGVDSTGVKFIDKKQIDLFPDIQANDTALVYKTYQIAASNKGDFMVLNEEYVLSKFYPINPPYKISKEVENGGEIIKIHFDSKINALDLSKNVVLYTTKFLYPYPLLQEKWRNSINSIHGNCISLNDSFLYFSKEVYHNDKVSLYESKIETYNKHLIQLDLFRANTAVLDSRPLKTPFIFILE